MTLAHHRMVNIPAAEAQEKVDRTTGVSDFVSTSVAVCFLVAYCEVYFTICRSTTSDKGLLERSG